MGLAGFDFQGLNRKYLAQPANDAGNYGASIVPAQASEAWRCIGIYHLTPTQNNRRHNVFIEVLDESGRRTNQPQIAFSRWMGNAVELRSLDKPDGEPAADIDIYNEDTITLWVAGALPSDSVGNLHTRHNDEGVQNTVGHHSYYVVFQLKRGTVVVVPPVEPPVLPPPVDPPTEPDVDRLTAIEAELARLSLNVDALWKRLDAMEGDG